MFVCRGVDLGCDGIVADQFARVVAVHEVQSLDLAFWGLDIKVRLVARHRLFDEVVQRGVSEVGLALAIVHADNRQAVLLESLNETLGFGLPVVDHFGRGGHNRDDDSDFLKDVQKNVRELMCAPHREKLNTPQQLRCLATWRPRSRSERRCG